MRTTIWALALLSALTALSRAQTYRDSGGTVVQGVATAGSTGADYSANEPAPPGVGGDFGASGPYAGYVLVTTIPANPARMSIDIENTSGSPIAVLLDDGRAANGAAPTNATLFSLNAGSGVGSQGGSWVSLTERGRVQIYAPSPSAQIAVRTN